MILYVNGDSNSTGITGGHWVEKLQQHYQCQVINHSLAGGSNPRILRTTRDFFENSSYDKKDLFVIIGWTSWEREEWLFQDQYVQVNASGTNSVPPALKDQYLRWVSDSESISQIAKSRVLHCEIFDLHRWFHSHKIKHLFFNALMPFQHEVLWQPEARLDWDNTFLGPYENDWSYFWFLKNRGYEPDSWNHHLFPAQHLWADTIIQQIHERKLLP